MLPKSGCVRNIGHACAEGAFQRLCSVCTFSIALAVPRTTRSAVASRHSRLVSHASNAPAENRVSKATAARHKPPMKRRSNAPPAGNNDSGGILRDVQLRQVNDENRSNG